MASTQNGSILRYGFDAKFISQNFRISENIMDLEVKGIKKSFRRKKPLIDISFGVNRGTIVGILGQNGSGKSTLLSILAGVQKCDAGEFLLDGVDLFKNSRLLSQNIGYIPQGTPLLEELTAWDNLLLWYSKEELMRELNDGGVLAMLGIGDFLKVPVHKMSGGMKKRLSIGCAVAKKPPILLLDEPSAALDLICKENINSYLKSCRDNGNILLLTTHDERELSLCDSLYILKNGYLEPFVYDGNVQGLVGQL